MYPRGLQVRGLAAPVGLGAGEPVLHGGLQGGPEEPGPDVSRRGGGPVLGARPALAQGVRRQHESEREA